MRRNGMIAESGSNGLTCDICVIREPCAGFSPHAVGYWKQFGVFGLRCGTLMALFAAMLEQLMRLSIWAIAAKTRDECREHRSGCPPLPVG